jgi:hypothetical protein
MSQVLACRFPGSNKTYDYFGNGERVRPGDIVEVETRRGTAFVEVDSVVAHRRNFATKEIKRVLTELEAAHHRSNHNG